MPPRGILREDDAAAHFSPLLRGILFSIVPSLLLWSLILWAVS